MPKGNDEHVRMPNTTNFKGMLCDSSSSVAAVTHLEVTASKVARRKSV